MTISTPSPGASGCLFVIAAPSGGGKTTLCNLVPRFFDVTGGRIAIDGRDVRDLTLASLRGHHVVDHLDPRRHAHHRGRGHHPAPAVTRP